jgi:hypothetical protein
MNLVGCSNTKPVNQKKIRSEFRPPFFFSQRTPGVSRKKIRTMVGSKSMTVPPMTTPFLSGSKVRDSVGSASFRMSHQCTDPSVDTEKNSDPVFFFFSKPGWAKYRERREFFFIQGGQKKKKKEDEKRDGRAWDDEPVLDWTQAML